MLNQYGLLGVGSGIAVALYLFSLIEKRTIHGPDPASSIPIPSRADSDGMLPIVFVLEWGVLAIFVLSELLPRDFQIWLKLSAISCGISTAILYALYVMRVKRPARVNSISAASTTPKRVPRRRRLRRGIRAHD